MIAYILRRLLLAIPTLLGVALIVLIIFHTVGGDPVEVMLGKNPTEQARAALNAKYGFDKPLILGFESRYLDLLWSTVTFDFGDSYNWKRPVRDVFAERWLPTLILSVPAFLLGALISIVLSLFVAFYRGTLGDYVVTTLSLAGISISSLLYILYGQAYLAHSWKLFPVWGFDMSMPP